MNDGKTTTSLALFAAPRTRTNKVGFIKPVGQRFVVVDGQNIDEDSVLLDSIFKVDIPIEAMSPISIHPTFTREFLDDPEQKEKIQIDRMSRFRPRSLRKRLCHYRGHWTCRVGSVFNLSNAQVARRLNAKVIIVVAEDRSTVDEIAPNQSLFQQAGVANAIINKVIPDKMEDIRHYCGAPWTHGNTLARLHPHRGTTRVPSLQQVARELDAQWINAREKTKITALSASLAP